jgi:hypothetical protein
MKRKLDSAGYDTDKSSTYLRTYERFFEPLVDKEIKLLELGVKDGGSLLLWRDYFKKGTIAGMDSDPVSLNDPTNRIRFYQGQQQDTTLLRHVAEETAPEGFDIIIDDCSHIGQLTGISFWYLFENHLKPGGIYAIEDWGTGYWDRWVDGRKYKPRDLFSHNGMRSFLASLIGFLFKRWNKGIISRLYKLSYYRQRFPSHDYGMVGFIKSLIDECGMKDITYEGRGISPSRSSKIKKMHISHGQVIITKVGGPGEHRL